MISRFPKRSIPFILSFLFLKMSLLTTLATLNAQMQSPDVFLEAYQEQFTPHHQVVAYAKHLAENSDRVKLFHYGDSYEGRPLILMAISNAENIERLDSLRIHHMRQIGFESGAVNKDLLKTIVWLSHGVHGNEASATESALMNMYALASGTSAIAKDLDKTIVMIDPCLNPDGFDRYVQFYKTRVGANSNANPATVEHHEPWPSGRVNHYQFDLNRDWAWQTQIESQQRMKVYFDWMPHIHVDIHEQYPENPYYFAPAAQPFHTEIEDWQVELQHDIGKNNARYFDKQAWAYFTGEVFDLFYPSYGDTYPILNGAIGMTYEQAGHGIAGLAYMLENEDTLSLEDRITHHHTTAMATVESTNYLHDTLIQLQTDYFSTFQPERFSAYLLKHNPKGHISLKKSFLELLERSKIDYQIIGPEASKMPVSIWDFGREEDLSYELQSGDVYIPADQRSGRLLKVLIETNPELKDTLTYDITSWSIALGYGDLYGLETTIDELELSAATLPENLSDRTRTDSNYAAILRFNEEQDYHTLMKLLKNDLKVRLASKAFTFEGHPEFPAGSIIIMKADNDKKYPSLKELNKKWNSYLDFVGTGWTKDGPDLGSEAFQLLKKPDIALLRDEGLDVNGFGFAWHFLDREIDYPYDVLSKAYLFRSLQDYNAIMIPDGRISFSEKELTKLEDWISNGGKLILIGGSGKMFADSERFKLKLKVNKPDTILDHPGNHYASHNPGAVVQLAWDTAHPLGYHMDDTYFSLKTTGLAFEPLQEGTVGKIGEEVKAYGFMGAEVQSSLRESMLFGVEEKGQGKLIYLADDPLYRGFWKRGHQIVWNALFFVQ